MRIDEIIARGDGPVFSFEFFPPKTPEGERNLFEALQALRPLEPDFVSVTWGAGGSTREKTIEIVKRVRSDHGLEAMAHFTCVGATVEDLHEALREMRDAGIENVLALRGDPPRGEERFVPTAGGLSYASELAGLVREHYDFCLVGACYPETHQEAPDAETDMESLQRKVEAGVSVLITQLFFDNADYFRFVEEVRGRGSTFRSSRGSCPSPTRARSTGSAACAGRASPRRCARSSRPAPTSPTPPPSWASPTPPSSAPTSWPAEPPASTSTRSTAPRPRAPSWRR